MGTDKDKNGELPGRPEFRRGVGEDNGNPIDKDNGMTGDVFVRIACAMASFGTDESNRAAARLIDAGRLMAQV
jgi:hypothetical protein